MAVHQVDPITDFARYRDIRLQALAADPAAFASTLEREQAFGDQLWQERLVGIDGRPAAFFLDVLVDFDNRDMATAGVAYTEWDPAPMLLAMWVKPEARGQGCGRRLIDAAVSWSRAQEAEALVLWVVRDNQPAIELYRRYGFEPTGEVDTVPSNPCAEELKMRLPLQ